jgi:hypothetical protein
MAGLFSNAGKNLMLDTLVAAADYVSAHTASPGDNGANEVNGGSYARQTNTWNAASAGAVDNSNAPVIPIPAGTTVTHLGLWSALTVGTFYGYITLASSQAFSTAGNLTVTDLDLDLNT